MRELIEKILKFFNVRENISPEQTLMKEIIQNIDVKYPFNSLITIDYTQINEYNFADIIESISDSIVRYNKYTRKFYIITKKDNSLHTIIVNDIFDDCKFIENSVVVCNEDGTEITIKLTSEDKNQNVYLDSIIHNNLEYIIFGIGDEVYLITNFMPGYQLFTIDTKKEGITKIKNISLITYADNVYLLVAGYVNTLRVFKYYTIPGFKNVLNKLIDSFGNVKFSGDYVPKV